MASPWSAFKQSIGAEVTALRNAANAVGDLATLQGGQAVHDAAQATTGGLGGVGTAMSGIPGVTEYASADRSAYGAAAHGLSTLLDVASFGQQGKDDRSGLGFGPSLQQSLGNVAGYFSPGTWAGAWHDTAHTSPGQSIIAPLVSPGSQGRDVTSPESDYFQHGWGKFLSGTTDAAISWYADPTVIAGKVAKVEKAKNVSRPLDQLDLASVNKELAAPTGAKSTGLSKQIDIAENTTDRATIRRLPMVWNSTRRDLLTDALVHAGPGEGRIIVRAALGDRAALDQLWDMKAAAADAIEQQTRPHITDHIDETGKVTSALEQLPPQTIAQHQKLLEALVPGTRDSAEYTNSGIQSTITNLGAKNNWIAEQQIARAGRMARSDTGAKVFGFWGVDRFQPSGFGMKVAVPVWNHIHGEAPSGHITIDGDQGFRAADELQADLNAAPHLRDAAGVARKQVLIQNVMNAHPGAGKLAALEGLENEVVNGIFRHYGLPENEGKAVIDAYHAQRKTQLAFEQRNGYLHDGDTLIKRAQLESQLANAVPILDFGLVAQLAKRHRNAILADSGDHLAQAKKVGYKYGVDLTFNSLRLFSSIWRPAVLLRLGFLIRNNLEGNLRSLAMTGELAGNPLLGARNVLNALADRVSVNGSKFAGLDRQAKIYQATHDSYQSVLDDIDAQIAETHGPEDLATLHESRAATAAAQADVAQKLDEVQRMNEAIRSKADYVTIGDKPINLRYQNGTVTFDGAYGGPVGSLLKANTSADVSWRMSTEGPSNARQKGLDIKASSWGDIAAPTAASTAKEVQHYWATLSDLGAKQFYNDRVARQFMAGRTPEEIHQWIKTPEGQQYTKKLAIRYADLDQHIMTTGAAVHQYFPDEAVQRKLASGEAVSPAALKKAIGDKAGKIHGQGLSGETGLISTDHLGHSLHNLTQKLFHYVGTMPEDSLTRHPFAAKMYESHLNDQLRIAEQQGLTLTSGDLKRMESSARAFAANETIKNLYTIQRYSNAAEFAQYVMPFYAAWANTARTWARIIGDDPSVLARAVMVWEAPNRMGVVYDQNGNKVDRPDGLDDNDVIQLQLPGSLTRVAEVFGAPVNSLNRISIPKGGLNVVTSGQPWYAPGFGPVVGIPASQIVKSRPEYGQVAKSLGILQGGRPDSTGLPLSAGEAFPAWAKRFLTYKEGQKSADYANTLNNVNATEMLKYRLGQRDTKPTANEIKSRTDAFYKMRIAFALLSPTSATFNSPFQFYRDEYRRLQESDPQTADQKFYEKYISTQGADKGTAIYEFATQSLSRNLTGVAPSVDAVNRSKKYNGLVQDVVGIDPAAVQLVTNGVNAATFDPAAYAYQQGKTVSPGSGVQYRSKYAPAEAQNDAAVQAGWLDYQASVARKNTELANRKAAGGSDSLNASSNSDLAGSWSDYINGLGNTNPAWWQAYNQRNDAGWENGVKSVQQIATNDHFQGSIKDPGEKQAWDLVDDYMTSRVAIVNALSQRASTNIDAKDNADLKTSWDEYVQTLTQQSTYFSNIYTRFLESDKLTPLHGKA